MKQIVIVMLLAVLGLTGTARDRLFIEDFSIAQGETKQIAIMLENDTVYSAFQTDFVMPDGLVVTQEDGEYIVDLTGRADRDHTVSTYLQPDGSLRIFVAVMFVVAFILVRTLMSITFLRYALHGRQHCICQRRQRIRVHHL